MINKVRRIYVEKKKGFDLEAQGLFRDLYENLGIKGLTGVRMLNRYDLSGVTDEEYLQARNTIFAELPVDNAYDEEIVLNPEDKIFAMEYLPGQYDQRADSAAQCIQFLTQKEQPTVASAKVVILEGEITEAELIKIKEYCINPVESREAALDKPESLEFSADVPKDVEVLEGFITKTSAELEEMIDDLGLAMSFADLEFTQQYFRETEKRDPTITEIRLIDTYWSDHCRHTTFFTEIEQVEFETVDSNEPIKQAYQKYLQARDYVYGEEVRDVSLMDIAVIGMKELKKKGLLDDLDESEEINACSIVVDVDRDGQREEWLVMFKNETHNHPTEIEPFGGAATCLGGAIRDPLSGRSYVYQAMRVSGSGDPRAKIEDTLPGKLPQRTITTGAAAGYSSYGNQIGLATGQVAEVYDENFIAKRMELGAVIGAAPRQNVNRQTPTEGDLVILVGGRTGRDGCGGATGSSKEHTEESILTSGAEVQKGNPPTERKIQRLFRNPVVSRMIKKCNDFGAGGVSVAIGELTDGLEINLDAVPKKYEGLDGTELAISESQERMAVVVSGDDAPSFIEHALQENLEATVVAKVTSEQRLKMFWRGKEIVDLSREFLSTNGVKQKTRVWVKGPKAEDNYFINHSEQVQKQLPQLKQAWLTNLQDLNVSSQRGLVERFDSTIGAGTILMPLGGKYQSTPAEGMVAKIPVLEGDTKTGTIMTYGYNPRLAKWSPFHGALYAVVEAVAKVVAMGGDYRTIRLSLQEYFEKLGNDPLRWGKPFSALLGAYLVQNQLDIPAIGGKDSMSGTFENLTVPPTLVAFAVNVIDVDKTISPEFKGAGNRVVLLPLKRDQREIPDFDQMKKNYDRLRELIDQGMVLAASTVRTGGLAATVSKMAFGNRIGLVFEKEIEPEELFSPDYGSLILELGEGVDLKKSFQGLDWTLLGKTLDRPTIFVNETEIDLEEAYAAWEKPLADIFPTDAEQILGQPQRICYDGRSLLRPTVKIAKPRVVIPVFPGTNCEYDTAKAFEQAGGIVETIVIRNLTQGDLEWSLQELVRGIENSQIIMLPGGFSAGDEPGGSGKFIATFFRNPRIKQAITEFLQQRDGLMLGICNGFQALVKLGLLPYGEIREVSEDSPTLTYNTIGRHISRLVQTKVVSNLSPWLANVQLGDVHTIAVSHGEGRFVANQTEINWMINNGQIATQYVDFEGNPSYDIRYNPNGSIEAIEGITSPDGRIFGKMGHSERIGANLYKNVPGEKDQKLFEAGISYFR